MSTPAPVVITGAGLVTSLGLDCESTWSAVAEGRCGIGPMSALESAPSPDKGGGQAPDLPPDFAPGLPREVRYLRWALREALAQAGLMLGGSRADLSAVAPRGAKAEARSYTAGDRAGLPYAPERCGFMLGTTLHGMRSAGVFLRSGDPGALGAFVAASVLQRAGEGLPVAGFAATTCAACASGMTAVTLGMALIQRGPFDLVLAGGYDTISEYAYGGFNSLRLVAEGPQRPFAASRAGMKLAEGYGIVVLERGADALRRGAPAFARILGAGGASDAHHLSEPHPEGEGAARAMADALRAAGLTPADIGLIAAHGTATPDNDAAEFRALSRVFGDALPRVPLTAFKSHLGHALGGAGAVELILTAMALRRQVAPPCANVRAEELEFPGLRVVTGAAHPMEARAAMTLSLGFGGSNACMVIDAPLSPSHGLQSPVQRPTSAAATVENPPPSVASDLDVLIAGVGVVFPGAVGNEAFVRRLAGDGSARLTSDAGRVDDAQLAGLLAARRLRRLSDYVKLSLAAATLACRDAGIASVGELPGACGAILGTHHGSVTYSADYYRQIVREGLNAANPLLFAEGVPNAGSAHLSMTLGLKGSCQTLIGSRTSGLDAVRLAALKIAAGEWDTAIVGAAEEYTPVLNEAYRHFGLYAGRAGGEPFGARGGFVAGAGAVTLVLESRASARRRAVEARGVVTAAASAVVSGRPGRRDIERAAGMVERLGRPRFVVASANATWLDRLEALALARSAGRAGGGGSSVVVGAAYGPIAECFSALPLAGLAAVLLTGRLPAPAGAERALSRRVRTAAGHERPDAFAVLATDYNGPISGIAIALPAGRRA